MSEPPPPGTLPMFPLNTVVFPGLTVPLHVFEERYVALVEHLLEIEDHTQRVFGTVAIREGYEVGDHGAQSVYRVGCLLIATEIESRGDGTYELAAVGRQRLVLEGMEATRPFPSGSVNYPDEYGVRPPQDVIDDARATFTAYRAAVSAFQEDPFSGSLPRDPEYLSWTLSALSPLTIADKQALLEAEGPTSRLELVTALLREELRAINVIPSLPATHVARTAWSPN